MDWSPGDDLMLYGRITRGYKTGGFLGGNEFALDPNDVAVYLDGFTRPYAPEWRAYAQARYQWQLSSSLDAGVQPNYSWRDDIYGEDVAITPLSYTVYSVESYGILNARAWMGPAHGEWEVALIGKNLTESEYWASGAGDDLGSFISTPGQRMSYAVEAGYSW